MTEKLDQYGRISWGHHKQRALRYYQVPGPLRVLFVLRRMAFARSSKVTTRVNPLQCPIVLSLVRIVPITVFVNVARAHRWRKDTVHSLPVPWCRLLQTYAQRVKPGFLLQYCLGAQMQHGPLPWMLVTIHGITQHACMTEFVRAVFKNSAVGKQMARSS